MAFLGTEYELRILGVSPYLQKKGLVDFPPFKDKHPKELS